jgi:hypothetical protein
MARLTVILMDELDDALDDVSGPTETVTARAEPTGRNASIAPNASDTVSFKMFFFTANGPYQC